MINTIYKINSQIYTKNQGYNKTAQPFTSKIKVPSKIQNSMDKSFLFNRLIKPNDNQQAQNMILLALNSIGIGLVDKSPEAKIPLLFGVLAFVLAAKDFFKTLKKS